MRLVSWEALVIRGRGGGIRWTIQGNVSISIATRGGMRLYQSNIRVVVDSQQLCDVSDIYGTAMLHSLVAGHQSVARLIADTSS